MSEFQPKPGDFVAEKRVVMPNGELWTCAPEEIAPWVPTEWIAALEALEEAVGKLRPNVVGGVQDAAVIAAYAGCRHWATREENR
jgi:hypothetical protein